MTWDLALYAVVGLCIAFCIGQALYLSFRNHKRISGPIEGPDWRRAVPKGFQVPQGHERVGVDERHTA